MIKKINRIWLLILLLLGVIELQGAPLSISAKLDSVNIMMGKINTLHLDIVEHEGTQGTLSIFNQIDRARGYALVCGDSVEIRTDYIIDTVKLGSGRIQLNYTIPIQAFDSGTFTLPKFIYKAGRDSVKSNSLTFNVVPVNVNIDDPIAGFDNVHKPDGERWYDGIPDWILDFWWIFIIIAIAICAFYYGLRNYSKKGLPFIIPKQQPKPWELALDSLKRLKSRKLWEQGMEKEYFTELTDILRIYLYERFGINAMEMTTRQIMDKILQSDIKDKKDYVKQILNVADFVKFAKVRPLPADSIAAYENARKFVEETIPVEKEEEAPKNQEGGEK